MLPVPPEKSDGCEGPLSMSSTLNDLVTWLEKRSNRTESLPSLNLPESDFTRVVLLPTPYVLPPRSMLAIDFQYFVGRRVKDSTSGRFDLDFIKIVNLTSAACSAAFQLGAAETKVAMDSLTASEAIAYMRALSGHVLRNHKQILSAAFNLNTPLVDDLAEPDAEGHYPVITDNIAIGRRGIQLAALGGFDKVTFDGAADSYPSECIVSIIY